MEGGWVSKDFGSSGDKVRGVMNLELEKIQGRGSNLFSRERIWKIKQSMRKFAVAWPGSWWKHNTDLIRCKRKGAVTLN